MGAWGNLGTFSTGLGLACSCVGFQNVVPRQPCQRPLRYPYVSSSPHEPTSEAQERQIRRHSAPSCRVNQLRRQGVTSSKRFQGVILFLVVHMGRGRRPLGRMWSLGGLNFHGMQPGRCGNGGLSQAAGPSRAPRRLHNFSSSGEFVLRKSANKQSRLPLGVALLEGAVYRPRLGDPRASGALEGRHPAGSWWWKVRGDDSSTPALRFKQTPFRALHCQETLDRITPSGPKSTIPYAGGTGLLLSIHILNSSG